MKIREMLAELYMRGWRDGEHPKANPIIMQELEVNKKLSQIKEILERMKTNNCETPNYHPEQRVTREMAIDGGDLSLEGSLYRQEEYERCGGCPSCIKDQILSDIIKSELE